MTTSCTCGATWSGSRPAHCARCHVTFASDSAFDRHLRGRDEDGRAIHLSPADLPDVFARNRRGFWALAGAGYWSERAS